MSDEDAFGWIIIILGVLVFILCLFIAECGAAAHAA